MYFIRLKIYVLKISGLKIIALFLVSHKPTEDAREIHATLVAEAEQGGVQFAGFRIALTKPKVVVIVFLHDERFHTSIGQSYLFHF